MARALGVSQQVICNWRARGLPIEWVLRVAAATGFEVTPHDLRPDLYPNPTDALPRATAPAANNPNHTEAA